MDKVKVETSGKNYTQKVTARSHRWLADEPEDLGGADKGPNPYEQLLGGLGSCTVTTVQMYAERKDWPLKKVEAVLEHKKVQAPGEGAADKISEIKIDLKLAGDLDDSQRKRLHKIANRCPVKRTLEGEIKIKADRGDAAVDSQ